MATDHQIIGPVKADNVAKLKNFIAVLIDESAKRTPAQQHADKIEIAALSRLLDEYIRGQFHWEEIFPKATVR